MRIVRKIAVLAAAAVLLVASPASAGTVWTQAMALNLNGNGRTVFDLAFDVRSDSGPAAVATNQAIARAVRCNGCRTIAISVQVDLVKGDVALVNATNLTQAINVACQRCTTVAAAHQFVVAAGGDLVWLTPAGRAALADIRNKLNQLRWSTDSGPAIDSQIDALMGEVAGVLQTQVVTSGQAPLMTARGASLGTALADGQTATRQ